MMGRGIRYLCSIEKKSMPAWLRSGLGALGYNSKESIYIRQANAMIASIRAAGTQEDLFKASELDMKTFRDHHSVLSLHLWLLNRRIGVDSQEDAHHVTKLKQELFDFFWEDSIGRIRELQNVRELMVNKHLRTTQTYTFALMKDLDQVFIPNAANTEPKSNEGHDQSVLLGQALWRGVFQEREETRDRSVESLIGYLSRADEMLEGLDTESVRWGRVGWSECL